MSGRLRSQQRQLEVELMRFCFRKLGLPRHYNAPWQLQCVLVLSLLDVHELPGKMTDE